MVVDIKVVGTRVVDEDVVDKSVIDEDVTDDDVEDENMVDVMDDDVLDDVVVESWSALEICPMLILTSTSSGSVSPSRITSVWVETSGASGGHD